jgi:hypothetical protein
MAVRIENFLIIVVKIRKGILVYAYVFLETTRLSSRPRNRWEDEVKKDKD